MSKNYEHRDVRMQAIREQVKISQGDESYDKARCAECGAIIEPRDVSYYIKDDEREWCSVCIESYSALEEEGRVPSEFQERA